MSETTTLSTIIDSRLKDAVTEFCRRRGIKIRHMVEQGLIEQLEDEIDLEAYRLRRDEETYPLDEVLAALERRKL